MRVTDSAAAAAVARQDILLASRHIDVPAADAAATVSCGQKERLRRYVDKSGRAAERGRKGSFVFMGKLAIFHLKVSSGLS